MAATTVVVSSRIEEPVAARVAARIKAEGLTVGEVIKRVWDQIAKTGELPKQIVETKDNEALARLHSLQVRFADMPDSFNAMTKDQMRDILGGRDV